MNRPPPLQIIAMSQIIASDAPLLSPTAEHSYQQQLYSPTNESFTYNYYLPPSPPNSVGSAMADSPIPAERVLKMRTTDNRDSEGLCISTHKVFDIHPHSSSSPLEGPASHRPTISIKPPIPPPMASPVALKRSASPTPPVARKRSVAERIKVQDFVAPDVSGLSKREARLVKNRAAAFLSRQRKREEFETMEMYVNHSSLFIGFEANSRIPLDVLLSWSRKTLDY